MPGTGSGEIFRALKTIWAGAESLGEIKIFRDEAPDAVLEGENQYVIFTSISNVHIRTTAASEHWRHTFRFTVRDTTPEAVEDLVNTIGAVFDAATPADFSLGAGNGVVLMIRRLDERYAQEDKRVNRGSLEYLIERQKPRADRQ